MTAPVLPIVWSYRRSFLFVTCLTFAVLAAAIFALPKPRVAVRSAIEIGVINKRMEPLDSPADVAKRISGVYGPAALLAMAAKGVPPAILGSLQNPGVDAIGRTVVVVSNVDPGAENEAKEFQGAIFDEIIGQQGPRAKALRDDLAAKITLAKTASGDLDQDAKGLAKQIERLGALSDDLRSQIEEQRAYLTTFYLSLIHI